MKNKLLVLVGLVIQIQSSSAVDKLIDDEAIIPNYTSEQRLHIQKELARLDPNFHFNPDASDKDIFRAANHLELYMMKEELAALDPQYVFDPKDPNTDFNAAIGRLSNLKIKAEIANLDPNYTYDVNDERAADAAGIYHNGLMIRKELAPLDPDYRFDPKDSESTRVAEQYLERLKAERGNGTGSK